MAYRCFTRAVPRSRCPLINSALNRQQFSNFSTFVKHIADATAEKRLHVQCSAFNRRNFCDSSLTNSAKKYEGKSLQELLSAVDTAAYKLFYVRLDNGEIMTLSALYAQATEGKCKEPKPPESQPKELMYWNNWKELGDMPQETAAKKYLEIAEKYIHK